MTLFVALAIGILLFDLLFLLYRAYVTREKRRPGWSGRR